VVEKMERSPKSVCHALSNVLKSNVFRFFVEIVSSFGYDTSRNGQTDI